MSTRVLLLPMLAVSLFSSAVTFAVAMLAFPPAGRAAPDAQFFPTIQTQRIAVVDPDGHPHIELYVGDDRSAYAVFRGPLGHDRMELGVDGQGNAALNLRGQAENVRASVGVSLPGAPAFTAYDANGRVVWRAP